MGLVSVFCLCSGHYEASVPSESGRNIYKGQLFYATGCFHAHTLACIRMLHICICVHILYNCILSFTHPSFLF